MESQIFQMAQNSFARKFYPLNNKTISYPNPDFKNSNNKPGLDKFDVNCKNESFSSRSAIFKPFLTRKLQILPKIQFELDKKERKKSLANFDHVSKKEQNDNSRINLPQLNQTFIFEKRQRKVSVATINKNTSDYIDAYLKSRTSFFRPENINELALSTQRLENSVKQRKISKDIFRISTPVKKDSYKRPQLLTPINTEL